MQELMCSLKPWNTICIMKLPSTWKRQNWKVASWREWNMDKLGYLLHTWSKGHCKRQFTSSEPKVNKYKQQALAKQWKNRTDHLTPWERAYHKIPHLLEAIRSGKKPLPPLRPRRPDHHSHDRLLKELIHWPQVNHLNKKAKAVSDSGVGIRLHELLSKRFRETLRLFTRGFFYYFTKRLSNSEDQELVIRCQAGLVILLSFCKLWNLHSLFFFRAR